MTKDEIISRIDDAISEMQALKNEVQNISEENNDDIVPETIKFLLNEPFFYVDRDGRIASNGYHGNGVEGEMINHKRLFKTYDYAEKFRRKSQFIADLLHFKWLYDSEFVPDWNNREQRKYYVYYNMVVGGWCVEWHNVFNYNSVVFSDEEIAQKCADWLDSRKENNNEDPQS